MSTDDKNADKPSGDWVVITTEFDSTTLHPTTPRGAIMVVWADLTDEETKATTIEGEPPTMIGLEPWWGRAKLFASHAEAGAAFRAEWGKLSKPWKVVRLTNRESAVARSNPDDFPDGYWDDDDNYIGPGAPGSDIAVADEVAAEVVVTLPVDEAQALTTRIRHSLDSIERDLVIAWHGKIWEPLGYTDWDAWVGAEFEGIALALPRATRKESMQSMKAAGLTTRAIAAVTGVDQATVSRATTAKPKPDANASPADEPVDVDEVDLPDETAEPVDLPDETAEPVDQPDEATPHKEPIAEEGDAAYLARLVASIGDRATILMGDTVELSENWTSEGPSVEKLKAIIANLKAAAANVEDIIGV